MPSHFEPIRVVLILIDKATNANIDDTTCHTNHIQHRIRMGTDGLQDTQRRRPAKTEECHEEPTPMILDQTQHRLDDRCNPFADANSAGTNSPLTQNVEKHPHEWTT